MSSHLRRITPSMAVAILAIVIALSSSATAALVISGKQIKDHSITGEDLRKNAVKSRTIKNKTVKGKDLEKGAVKGVQVLDRSLTGADLRSSTITGKELAEGTITSSNLTTTLLRTLAGGSSGFQVVTAQSQGSVPLVAARSVTATCPAGKVAISANAFTESPIDLLPPTQIERTATNSFTASDANAVNVLAAGPLSLQVTCVSG